MSMQNFLNGECGQNPVLKVASYFTQDNLAAGSSYGAYTKDGLLPPTTFKMDSLLREVQAMGRSSVAPVQAPPVAELAAHPEWAQEFLEHEQFVQEPNSGPQEWVRDYMAKELELDSIWDKEQNERILMGNHARGGELVGAVHTQMEPAPYHPISNHPGVSYPITAMLHPSARDLLDDSKWVAELESETQSPLEKTELMATAKEFLKSVSDPKIKATEFMNFVEKLSTGEIGADGASASQRSAQWAEEYANRHNPEDVLWSDEFVTGNGGVSEGEDKNTYWQKLNEEWEKLAQESPVHPWLADPGSVIGQPYSFSEENPFTADIQNPFEEGKRKLQAGDIPSAALLFEAAVKKDGDNPECWLYLGTTQALNEQDPLSIAALNKCLELQPDNLRALMSIAASLTNESFHHQSCHALKRWLKSNPKYSSLVPEDVPASFSNTTSIIFPDELLKVQRLFIQAARLNPSSGVDPEVQSGLGILFTLGSDYDKAADCFRAAIGADPDNPLLLNRLGATLANGRNASEAIGAYRRALELVPGFVRTRHNLGIACVDLGAYREASEHFLSALLIQSNGKPVQANGKPAMSDAIWTALRSSLHLQEKPYLTRYIDSRDLDSLLREFGLTKPTP